MRPNNRFLFLHAGAEACTLLLPSALFLRAYIGLAADAREAIVPHLALLATIWSAVVLVRILAWRLLPTVAAAFCSVAATATTWLVIVAYYALATVGLQSWGRIITWPMVKPYVLDIGALLEYLETPPLLVIASFGIAVGLAAAIWWVIAGPGDWSRSVRALRGRLFWSMVVGLLAAGGIRLGAYFDSPPTYVNEPVALTLFPAPPVEFGQRQWPRDPARQIREDEARALLKTARPTRRPTVVLIVSDALRADHMSIFGYPRGTTPRIDERVDISAAGQPMRAVAACAETSCAMPALLYSKRPREMILGALGLSEAMRALGYRPYILLSGDHTNYYGLSQLYRPADLYFDATTQHERFVNDDRMVLDAVARLPPPDPRHPAFIQVHLLSNHPLGMRWPTSGWFMPTANYARWVKGNKGVFLSERQRVLAQNYYDNGVRQMDQVVEMVLLELAKRGYLDEAFVAITGDHGEMLGEHSMLSHAAGVYQPVLEVPAVFLRYGYAAQTLPHQPWIAQMDLAPTILGELGVPAPQTWTGVALQHGLHRTSIPFEQGNEAGLLLTAGAYRGYKYWIDLDTQREHVFDLTTDPGEQHNLATRVPLDIRRSWRWKTLDGRRRIEPE